jgi:predicted anti-sigma-YlaC factor YlaD
MQHIQPDLMQRFLADEVDLMEREAVTEHLAECDACAALLVQMTADDDSLSQALRLDDDEAAWIASLDLTAPVLAKMRPWYREPAVLAITVPLILLAGYLFHLVTSLILGALGTEGPVGTTVELLRSLIPALWRLNLYLGHGGLLRTLWPVLVLAGAAWLWKSRTNKKEYENHA